MMFALSIGLVLVMPLNFKLLISLLSDFCCLIKVNRRLFGRWNSDVVSCFLLSQDLVGPQDLGNI